MNKIKFTFSVVAFSALVLTGCKKDDAVKGCMNKFSANYNPDATEDDGSCSGTSYAVPSTYEFKDASGNNTVSYSGQQQRLDMLSEMVTLMKSANTAGTAVSAQVLKDMYANNNYTWTDANSLGMTGSSKQLKSKTALGDAGIQAMFEIYMDSLAALSAKTVQGQENGAPGVGGVWPKDVKGPYLMSGKGVEYTQLIEKGLMAAVFMNQMTVNYLGGLDSDDNAAAVDAGNGKYYTEMEHHWDEAYGYFTSEVNFPTAGTDRFWGKYANSREALLGSAKKIADAFRKGRAAVTAKDYTTRDAQVKIIKDEMEKACAGTAIHYLNAAITNIANGTARNHQLSEAVAFLGGLKYGANAVSGTGMTSAQIDVALGYIGDDFTKVTVANLQKAIDEIAKNTGLESVKASL